MVKASGALRLLVVVAVVATGLGLAAAPAAAAPALIVSPATGLLDQQIVTVTGSGFAAGEQLIVAQCPATLADCDLDPAVNTTGALATVSSSGAIGATLRLSRVLALDGGDVSCAVEDCVIVAVTREGHAERARTAIAFAATGTAPSPDATLSIAVTDMRARGGRAAYTGSGFLPWFRTTFIHTDEPIPISVAHLVDSDGGGAYLALCTAPPSGWAGCERYVSPLTTVPGSSGAAFKLHQWVPVSTTGTVSDQGRDLPRMWETDHGRVDCAVEDCSFALEQDGAPHSNVVDVAWVPEWSPWPSATAFVTDAYEALVGRRPTTSERSAAIAGLTDRSLTGFALLRQLAGRSDARPLAELTRLYQAALGRRPDAGGLLYWERELRRLGGNVNAIASAFGRSPEFRQVFGSVSDTQAVTLAYERTLGRTPSNGERSYWVGQLRAGVSRPHMIHLFSRSPEYLGREAGRSQATAITVTLLGRGPTADAWTLLGPDWYGRDVRTVTQRVDDIVLSVLSSDTLRNAVN